MTLSDRLDDATFDDDGDATVARELVDELSPGVTHFKSRDLADGTSLTVKQVAYRLDRVTDALGLELDAWGAKKQGRTWQIHVDATEFEADADAEDSAVGGSA